MDEFTIEQSHKHYDRSAGPINNVGFLTKNKKLFPIGYKEKLFFISTMGTPTMRKCPKCDHFQGPSDAVKGICRECFYDIGKELIER